MTTILFCRKVVIISVILNYFRFLFLKVWSISHVIYESVSYMMYEIPSQHKHLAILVWKSGFLKLAGTLHFWDCRDHKTPWENHYDPQRFDLPLRNFLNLLIEDLASYIIFGNCPMVLLPVKILPVKEIPMLFYR